MNTRLNITAAAVLAAIFLVACGGSEPSGTATATRPAESHEAEHGPEAIKLSPEQLRSAGIDFSVAGPAQIRETLRSEGHTSELHSLMRISYAVFCLKKKKNTGQNLGDEQREQQATQLQQTTKTQ